MKIETVKFGKSFICSGCNHAFFHNNYLMYHLKCKHCNYYLCSNCQIEERDEKKLIREMVKDEALSKFVTKRVKKEEDLPIRGLCIFLERKDPKIETFRYLKF